MATVTYTAKARDSRILELPAEAQVLGLQAGQELVVTVDREGGEGATSVPNEKGLAAMREIAERQKDRPCAEGSDVVKLVREARAGAMYGYGGTE